MSSSTSFTRAEGAASPGRANGRMEVIEGDLGDLGDFGEVDLNGVRELGIRRCRLSRDW